MDFLFGADTPLAVRFFIAFVIVLGLIGGTAYLVRRFGGERLAAAGRGRQPRLAVVDAAAVDGRRRLILIRRDNVEHLLLIGGPSDVVVEPNILRAAAPREAPPPRAPNAADAISRPVPLGEAGMWPLQPQVEAPPPAPPVPRPQPPPPVEVPMQWQAEPEPHAPQQRQSRQADPLAGLAAELARTVPQAEPAPPMPRRPARVPAREAARAPAREITAEAANESAPEPVYEPAPEAQAPPPPEPQFASPSDQNLADMAHRLEAALRRPSTKRPEDMRIADLAPKVPLTALDPLPSSMPPEPRPSRGEVRALRAEPPRMEAPRVEASRIEAPRAEVHRAEMHRSEIPRTEAPRAEALRADVPRAEAPHPEPMPGQQRSLYDSLEQEMASLLGRPNQN